jgi:two-component system response regulator NreC
MAIRILIADDHRIMRAGLKSLMNADAGLEVVGEATNSEEAMRLTQELQPDIVLMDIGMPGNENLEATGKIAALDPMIRVLILTMHEDKAMLQECLRLGASGYIIKRAAESELIDAIYAVQRGMIYVHPSMIQSLVALPQKSNIHHKGDEELTAREIEVLLLIVDGNTNRQISDKLHISVRTVETHRSNIMDKLNLHSRVELVRYVNEHHLNKLH